MLMSVRLVQPRNAFQPMLLTLSGILMFVRAVQPSKAFLLMLVTLSGIMVFLHPRSNELVEVSIIPLQLSRESYTVFSLSTMIPESPEQLEKALFSIDVTLLGIVTDVKPVQP